MNLNTVQFTEKNLTAILNECNIDVKNTTWEEVRNTVDVYTFYDAQDNGEEVDFDQLKEVFNKMRA